MKSIELRIMGGLGNQLYQYAAARFIQKRYSCPEIVINSVEYDTYKIRNLEINSLLNNDKVRFEKNKNIKDGFIRTIYRIYQRLYHDIRKKHAGEIVLRIGSTVYLLSTTEFFEPKRLLCKRLYMYGYFVSSNTAMAIKKELMSEIRLQSIVHEGFLKYKNIFMNEETIGVSVRCARDYVDNGWPVCSSEYYIKGVKEIFKQKQNTKPIIAVFADDLKKVMKEDWFHVFDNVIYIEGLNVCESFELLRYCQDYVCSNSSFSWWGAFLSYSSKPLIVNPNRVFAGNSKIDDMATFYQGMVFLDYLTGEPVELINGIESQSLVCEKEAK